MDGQQHILVIDGSQVLLDLLRDLLEGEGYRVSTQTTLDQDLNPIIHLAPGLIILDDLCRTEDQGWSLLGRLRADPGTQAIPVILCTGVQDEVEGLGEHLTELGVRVVLKPFDLDHLLRVIRHALGPHGVGAQPVHRANNSPSPPLKPDGHDALCAGDVG